MRTRETATVKVVRCLLCKSTFELLDQLKPEERGVYWDQLIEWLRQHGEHIDRLRLAVETRDR